GYTPLDGLMMGTRSGAVDPGILMFVQKQHGISAELLDSMLNQESGLFGVSGISSDFREVAQAAMQGSERAQLALDIYSDSIVSAIGGLAVKMGGVDALVFTAGVGENSALLRKGVTTGLQCLGLHLDKTRNETGAPDCDLSSVDSPARILLIKTQEELLIAQEALRLAHLL
ncbi:MAG TPA: acetate kinase, partial [Pirellulaceae bacterium]|nr:acetate kinase [Pirellulaceae bacterium]